MKSKPLENSSAKHVRCRHINITLIPEIRHAARYGRLDEEFLLELGQMVATRGYQHCSEAIRDLTRAALQQSAQETHPSHTCVAALVYVYDHETRELSKRLTLSFHDHRNLSLAAMHVHLDQ